MLLGKSSLLTPFSPFSLHGKCVREYNVSDTGKADYIEALLHISLSNISYSGRYAALGKAANYVWQVSIFVNGHGGLPIQTVKLGICYSLVLNIPFDIFVDLE